MTQIQTWPHITGIAILDIALVAIIIYQLLMLIRGTRAAPMLVGVAALAMAFYLARIGDLPTLNWLLSTLLPYVVFALIVVFQAEIRHALAGLGRRLSFNRSASSEEDAYDDIVLAANLFSQNQTGALIVIEREIGLRTYIESGVPLDARLSYDLLATIFRPSAPLHDGAVIVQGDRIAAAACFLPLSMNPVLSTQMGTRHRAGIGITEDRGNCFGRIRRDQPRCLWQRRTRHQRRATARATELIVEPVCSACHFADSGQRHGGRARRKREWASNFAAFGDGQLRWPISFSATS
jgi:diadenylate cyclase